MLHVQLVFEYIPQLMEGKKRQVSDGPYEISLYFWDHFTVHMSTLRWSPYICIGYNTITNILMSRGESMLVYATRNQTVV